MKIYGRHAAFEALKNPKREVIEIFVDHGDILDPSLRSGRRNIKVVDINKKFPQFQNHQGIVIEVKPLPVPHIESLTRQVLILDQITDPQNLGAIVRSAAAFGIEAIITQEYQGLLESSVMARVASGGLEHVHLIPVVNITRAIETLKEQEYWVYGLTEEGNEELSKIKFSQKSAVVVGAEGKGIRPLVLKNCDFKVKIKTNDQFPILNASHATSIALYQMTLPSSS